MTSEATSLEALRRSGALAGVALEALPATSVIVFDHDMRFVLTAGQALRSHGYDPERMRGRRLDEAVPARLAEQLAPHYRAALRGEHRTFQHEVPGSELCFEVSVTPVEHDGEIVGGMVIARDVSAQRAAERARAESERRYRELAEHASDVVTRAGPDDVYRYVSPSAKQRYGWTPEQMVGRAVTDFLHPTDHARHAEVRAALAAGADEQVAECRVARATGGWVWVELHYTVERDADGAPREVQAAARDITARKVAEAAGRAADAQFRAAFDSAPIGMALVAPNGAWLRVNPALCAILGYSHEELRERRFQDLTHPDDLDADLELVSRVLDGRLASYQMEKRYLHADGSVVWAQLSVSLVRDDEGRPLHFVSQVTDISERKRLEAELRRLATHDDLTGLHNRRAFEREIDRQLRRVRRYGEQCAVLLADLDDFKSVNDTLGHHAGDELLRHVAGLLTRRLRDSDIVARLGGDEFAVLLAHTDLAAAEALARALEAELAGHPLRIDGTEVVAHASFGAAVLDADVTPEDALRHADRAMYAVKRTRRLAGPERRERRD